MAVRLILVALLAAMVGVALTLHFAPHQPEYRKLRASYVRTAISSGDAVDTLVLGDSIGESVAWDCGSTFNASIGGAKLADATRIAATAVPQLRPQTIIVEIGANHFWTGNDPEFAGAYSKLVQGLKGRLILVGVPNSTAASRFIKAHAQRIGAAYVPPVTGALTVDGVHPNAGGARELRNRVAEVCK